MFIFETEDNYLTTDKLKNGFYHAMRYAWCFELENGKIYKCVHGGVKHTRKCSKYEFYYVEDGNIIPVDINKIYNISVLPEGQYYGMYYASTFELQDGRLFRTSTGVRHTRYMTNYHYYYVEDGDLWKLWDIENIENGKYLVKQYDNILELYKGKRYILPYKINCKKCDAEWKFINIIDKTNLKTI